MIQEHELIERAQAGDQEAFCLLARSYQRRIYALALHYTRDPYEAEDLSQEVWLKAYRALSGFRGEAGFYTCLRKPAGETHSDKVGTNRARCFLIEVTDEWLEHVREYAPSLRHPIIFQNSSLIPLALRLLREARQIDAMTPMAIEGLMLELIAEACRRSPRISEAKSPRFLERAKEMLQQCFLEPLSLSEIALAVGVHPVYLASAFRRHYRCSIGEYKRRLRVEFTCGEIAGSDAPLSQVALAAGYSDQAHFSRSFKRLTGMTPTDTVPMLVNSFPEKIHSLKRLRPWNKTAQTKLFGTARYLKQCCPHRRAFIETAVS